MNDLQNMLTYLIHVLQVKSSNSNDLSNDEEGMANIHAS